MNHGDYTRFRIDDEVLAREGYRSGRVIEAAARLGYRDGQMVGETELVWMRARVRCLVDELVWVENGVRLGWFAAAQWFLEDRGVPPILQGLELDRSSAAVSPVESVNGTVRGRTPGRVLACIGPRQYSRPEDDRRSGQAGHFQEGFPRYRRQRRGTDLGEDLVERSGE